MPRGSKHARLGDQTPVGSGVKALRWAAFEKSLLQGVLDLAHADSWRGYCRLKRGHLLPVCAKLRPKSPPKRAHFGLARTAEFSILKRNPVAAGKHHRQPGTV